jgi:hypothetical protein
MSDVTIPKARGGTFCCTSIARAGPDRRALARADGAWSHADLAGGLGSVTAAEVSSAVLREWGAVSVATTQNFMAG